MLKMNKIKSVTGALLFGIFLVLAGCGEPSEVSETPTAEEMQPETNKVPVTRDFSLGPVHAVVTLDNGNPTLGEPIVLSLTVDAASDVNVTMPEFGDQLGRFNIADYRSTEKLRDDGRYEFMQAYTLDLPMSGKLKTPSFLVEFIDNRAESEQRGKIQELLTESITFEVASVFAEGEQPEELYPVEGALPELVLPDVKKSNPWPYILLGLLLMAVAGFGIYRYRHPAPKPALPPDVIALTALDRMKSEPIPTERDLVDSWYVELSGIVRSYIEGRFTLHAPRLTTEEFFELARKSDALKDEHKLLIRKLLERSDRVKFTEFIPDSAESSEMLADAHRFVSETRITAADSEADHA